VTDGLGRTFYHTPQRKSYIKRVTMQGMLPSPQAQI